MLFTSFLLLMVFSFKGFSQVEIYSQGFEDESHGWTLNNGDAISNNNNWWVRGAGTAGAITGAATKSGGFSLQIWDRWNGSWYASYDNYGGQNRTAKKTFDFSSVPDGSLLIFSYWVLCRGEVLASVGPVDFVRLEINGDIVDGPLANILDWQERKVDISDYVGNDNVEIVIRWVNDNVEKFQPPARIDDIKIEYFTNGMKGSEEVTYTSGNHNTDRSFTSASHTSDCSVPLTVSLPEDAVIMSVDVEYEIEAISDAWKSEQRSELRCVSSNGQVEGIVYSGIGGVGGAQSYTRNNLSIANAVTSNEVNFELHAGRTYGGSGCEQAFQRVLNNTFKVKVNYFIPNPCSQPSTQATSFNSSNITSNSMDISWTRGDGDGVIVVARAGGAVNANPVSGSTSYTANATFGSGTEIGTGNYVVYRGTGTSVSLTGLDDDVTYHYAIYEYDDDAGDFCYKTPALTGSVYTPTCAGVASASAASVSACDQTVTLSLSDYSAGSIQWQWSPNNSTWYDIVGATSDEEESPYVTRATTYYRVKMSGGCTSNSNVVTVTSSAASGCYFWEGRTSTSYHTSSNWSGSSMPNGTTHNTYIPRGMPTCIFTNASETAHNVGNFFVQEGGLLDYQQNTLVNTIWIYGNLTCNGRISYSTNAQGYIAMRGTSKTLTAGANSDLSEMRLQISDGGTITLNSDIEIHEFLIHNAGTFNVGSNTLKTKYFGISSTGAASNVFNLNSGTVELGGGTAFDKSGPHLTGRTNPNFDHGTFNFDTGLFYYNSGDFSPAVNQTVKSRTYPNLKVRTNNGYTVTIGTGSSVTVTNDFTIENPGAAGGVATSVNEITANDVYLANTGNALTLNLGNRLRRSSGSGTFNMGDLADNQINVTYAHASNHVISGYGTPRFYGTFKYNSASDQQVIPAEYDNLIIDGAGTRPLAGNITVHKDLTIDNGALESISSRDITLYGNWTNNGTFTPGTGDVVFVGEGVSEVFKAAGGSETLYRSRV